MGFPAHAGMDPGRRLLPLTPCRIPRTRGDGPAFALLWTGVSTDSPHTRGWTVRRAMSPARGPGFPAHAGMDPGTISVVHDGLGIPRTRGDGPALAINADWTLTDSPHTRGWTRVHHAHWRPARGFPAHAGMDRSPATPASLSARIPRTRGDGPSPRALPPSSSPDSPHTRGWTLAEAEQPGRDRGFPAHAGMDPP